MTGRAQAPASIASNLRQMLAVLEQERQALAGLDIDQLVETSIHKHALCNELQPTSPSMIDEECRGLLVSAKQLNAVNARVRNLLAANVAARLEALTGKSSPYPTAGLQRE